jgi:hypothetical protein
MTAEVLPFPRIRHRRFVVRHAQRMAHLPLPTVEKHLAHQLEFQRSTMIKRGIGADLITKEVAQLERAILALYWQITSGGGPHEQEG